MYLVQNEMYVCLGVHTETLVDLSNITKVRKVALFPQTCMSVIEPGPAGCIGWAPFFMLVVVINLGWSSEALGFVLLELGAIGDVTTGIPVFPRATTFDWKHIVMLQDLF